MTDKQTSYPRIVNGSKALAIFLLEGKPLITEVLSANKLAYLTLPHRTVITKFIHFPLFLSIIAFLAKKVCPC